MLVRTEADTCVIPVCIAVLAAVEPVWIVVLSDTIATVTVIVACDIPDRIDTVNDSIAADIDVFHPCVLDEIPV